MAINSDLLACIKGRNKTQHLGFVFRQENMY